MLQQAVFDSRLYFRSPVSNAIPKVFQ